MLAVYGWPGSWCGCGPAVCLLLMACDPCIGHCDLTVCGLLCCALGCLGLWLDMGSVCSSCKYGVYIMVYGCRGAGVFGLILRCGVCGSLWYSGYHFGGPYVW